MQSARPSIIFQERPPAERRGPKREEGDGGEGGEGAGERKKRGVKKGRGKRLSRGDERRLYKIQRGWGGTGEESGGMQQSYLAV